MEPPCDVVAPHLRFSLDVAVLAVEADAARLLGVVGFALRAEQLLELLLVVELYLAELLVAGHADLDADAPHLNLDEEEGALVVGALVQPLASGFCRREPPCTSPRTSGRPRPLGESQGAHSPGNYHAGRG